MQPRLLIELGIRPGDYRLRTVLRAVETEHLVNRGKVHRVPHLSLYGNAWVPPSGWPDLRRRVEEVCREYQTLLYLVDDYDTRSTNEGDVIAFRIGPSRELLSFRQDLIRSLGNRFPSEKPYDKKGVEPWFHVTIAHKLSESEQAKVWGYLTQRDLEGESERGLPFSTGNGPEAVE